jgi:hypothetical protein
MLLLLGLASADLLIPAELGQVHITHSVRIDGIPPEFVVVAFDGSPGGEVGTYRAFTADHPELVIATGGNSRGATLGAPALYGMTAEAYAEWDAVRSAEVARQEEACLNGEGCAHISRFVPSFATPTAVIPCGLSLEPTGSAPEGSPLQRTDVFTATVTAEACTVTPAAAPSDAPGDVPAGAAPGTTSGASVESTDCSTAPGPVSVLLGLGLLLLARRP